MDETGQSTPETLEDSPKQFTDLKEFQQEVARLKASEEEEGKTAHFTHLNPEDLTEDDMQAYNDFLIKNWDSERFLAYWDKIIAALQKEPTDKKIKSRRDFAAYLGNIWQYEVTKREIEALKNKNQ